MQISRKILTTSGVMIILMHPGRKSRFSENRHFLIKFCIKLHISEQLIVSIPTFYMIQICNIIISK